MFFPSPLNISTPNPLLTNLRDIVSNSDDVFHALLVFKEQVRIIVHLLLLGLCALPVFGSLLMCLFIRARRWQSQFFVDCISL